MPNKNLAKPRFAEVLDVNSVLELGYSVHVANDAKTEHTNGGKVARQLLDEFQSWRAPVGSADQIYLFKTRQLVLSLGNGITRRKHTFLKEIEAAEHQRAEALARLSTARHDDFWFTFWLKGATAAGIMTVAAAIGFALAETVLPFVPRHSEHTQTAISAAGYWPSLLVAGIFAAIGRNCSKWVSQQQLEKIYAQYEIAHRLAWQRYQKGKLAEYQRTETEVRRLLQAYTGRRPPRCMNYSVILNEEMATDRLLSRERAKLSENFLLRTMARVRRIRKRHHHKTKHKTILESAAGESHA